jgi:hypothetical protein
VNLMMVGLGGWKRQLRSHLRRLLLRPPAGALYPLNLGILVSSVGGVQGYVARDFAVLEPDPRLQLIPPQLVLFDHDLAGAAFPVRITTMARVTIEAER